MTRMRMLSMICELSEVENTKALIIAEGMIIYKVMDLDEIIPGLGLQTTKSTIIFCVMDESIITLLKLKYPYDTFREYK